MSAANGYVLQAKTCDYGDAPDDHIAQDSAPAIPNPSTGAVLGTI